MQILITILVKTPVWMWPLLAALVWLGYSRTKIRDTSPIPLLIPPAVFTALVVVKLILSGFAPTLLFGTASGIVLGLLAVLWLKPARNTMRLPNGRLRIEGEWVSLGVMLLAFIANYAAGVIGSVAPQIATGPELQYTIALINGLSASLTTGRAYAYLRTKQTVSMPTPIMLELEG